MSTEQPLQLKTKVFALSTVPIFTMALGLILYFTTTPSVNTLQSNTFTLVTIVLTVLCSLLVAWVINRRIFALLEQSSSTKKELQLKIDHAKEALTLQNIELDIARKRALDASNIKSDFLAHMSHEIRTPMNGIVGFTDLLSKTDLTSDQRKYIEIIKQSSNNLLNLTNSVLSFSKIEKGHFNTAPQPFKIRKCCEECVAQYMQIAHSKRIELLLLVYDDVPNNLKGDPARIFQILSNLIDNAIKYTHEGEVIIRVMLEDETDMDCTLQINVTDTGIGIEKSIQKNLFIPFNQEDTSKIRQYDGAGLGLSICQRLIDTLHGTINIDSRPGEGSSFQFTLRLDKTPSQSIDAPPKILAEKKIALYDSHKISRTSISSQLARLSINVQHYDTIEQLLALNSDDIDLIIAGFSGNEFQSQQAKKTVAKLHGSLAPPVLSLISISEHSSLQSILEAGAIECHTKPIKQTTLAHLLTKIFTNTKNNQCRNIAQPLIDYHFLIVDDDPINHELMDALLEDKNVHITHANNGQEAIALAAKYHYDLILMDIHMPDMSGMETTEIIRSREEPSQHIPIIALTADIGMQIQKQASLAGMDAYLTKPFNEKKLWSTIELLFNQQPSTQSSNSNINTTFSNSTGNKKIENNDQATLPRRDYKHALSVSGGSEALADKMFSALQKELPKQLTSMQKLAADGDYDALWNIAHRMHGSTAICGVPALNQAVAMLEKTIKSGTNEEKQLCLKQVAHEINRLLNS